MQLYKQLTHNDLTKRGGTRVKIFTDKIKTKKQFVTMKGVVTLTETQTVNGQKLKPDELAGAMMKPGFKTKFAGKKENGSPITLDYPSDFLKTPEFGGKGAGAGTKAEDAELTLFRNKIEEAKKNDPYIKISTNGRVIKVATIISTPGPGGGKNTPKADFTLVDAEGKHVGWISHKAGRKASDFQQYGGLTADNFINNHPETRHFMNDLLTRKPLGLESGETFWRTVTNSQIDLHSVFGKNYGGKPGDFNCDEFHLGEMKLSKVGQTYKIISLHKGTNGDVSSGAFSTVFLARYDRASYTASGITIKNCRIGVFPRGKVPNNATEI